MFPDHPPYGSDEQARTLHSSDIPWFEKIKPSTLIVTGSQLGTPTPVDVGLYKSITCINNEESVKSWKPGQRTTMMQDSYTGYIPEVTWDAISNLLGAPIIRPTNPTFRPQIDSEDESASQ